jgi:hypothetical protein
LELESKQAKKTAVSNARFMQHLQQQKSYGAKQPQQTPRELKKRSFELEFSISKGGSRIDTTAATAHNYNNPSTPSPSCNIQLPSRSNQTLAISTIIMLTPAPPAAVGDSRERFSGDQ